MGVFYQLTFVDFCIQCQVLCYSWKCAWKTVIKIR